MFTRRRPRRRLRRPPLLVVITVCAPAWCLVPRASVGFWVLPIVGVATTPGRYLPPPQEPAIPRDYSLKLDQQSSKLRVGESTEVECYSSDNSYTDVIWERADGAPLTANIQVRSTEGKSLTETHFSFPLGYSNKATDWSSLR